MKAACLVRPSLGDYTAALLLHSPRLSKSQERPRFRVGRSRRHCWMEVWQRMCCHLYFTPAAYYVPSTLVSALSLLYKPENHGAGYTSSSSVCHLGIWRSEIFSYRVNKCVKWDLDASAFVSTAS